jgi:hypothetical protein
MGRLLDIFNCDHIRRLTLARLFLLLETIDTSEHRVILTFNIWNSTCFRSVQIKFVLVILLLYVGLDFSAERNRYLKGLNIYSCIRLYTDGTTPLRIKELRNHCNRPSNLRAVDE